MRAELLLRFCCRRRASHAHVHVHVHDHTAIQQPAITNQTPPEQNRTAPHHTATHETVAVGCRACSVGSPCSRSAPPSLPPSPPFRHVHRLASRAIRCVDRPASRSCLSTHRFTFTFPPSTYSVHSISSRMFSITAAADACGSGSGSGSGEAMYPAAVQAAAQALQQRDPGIAAALEEDIRRLYAPGAAIDASLVRRQVQRYYLPVYAYLEQVYDAHAGRFAAGSGSGSGSGSGPPPLLVGISAPQGCGKTTLTDLLIRLFQRRYVRCDALRAAVCAVGCGIARRWPCVHAPLPSPLTSLSPLPSCAP